MVYLNVSLAFTCVKPLLVLFIQIFSFSLNIHKIYLNLLFWFTYLFMLRVFNVVLIEEGRGQRVID